MRGHRRSTRRPGRRRPRAARVARRSAELAGGLTNTNYKVDTDQGAYVVRISAKDAGLLAIDRENEYLNTVAAAEAGVGAAVVGYMPERSLMVLEFIEGQTQSAERPAPRGQARDGGRRLPAAARRRPLPRRLQHVRHPAPLPGAGAGARLPAARPLPRVRAGGAPDRAAMAVRDEGTVPCNNDLLAENFIDVGGGFRLIDYEYSGNNDACFELGNVWSESNLSLDQLERAGRPLLRAAAAQQGGAGAPVGADVEVRLDALGLDPGRRLGHRLRLLGVGPGEVRAGGGRVRRARLRPPARRGHARGLSPAPAKHVTAPTGGRRPKSPKTGDMRNRSALLAVLLPALVIPLLRAQPAAAHTTVYVSSAASFQSAVTQLRSSGGTIVLLRNVYSRELRVGPRSSRLLDIVGTRRARVRSILLDRTQSVHVRRLSIRAMTADGGIHAQYSQHLVFRGLTFSARRTRHRVSLTSTTPATCWSRTAASRTAATTLRAGRCACCRGGHRRSPSKTTGSTTASAATSSTAVPGRT